MLLTRRARTAITSSRSSLLCTGAIFWIFSSFLVALKIYLDANRYIVYLFIKALFVGFSAVELVCRVYVSICYCQSRIFFARRSWVYFKVLPLYGHLLRPISPKKTRHRTSSGILCDSAQLRPSTACDVPARETLPTWGYVVRNVCKNFDDFQTDRGLGSFQNECETTRSWSAATKINSRPPKSAVPGVPATANLVNYAKISASRVVSIALLSSAYYYYLFAVFAWARGNIVMIYTL